MTVLEFFDYEKQLLADYDAVKTPHARNAVYKQLVDVLESHKRFVTNTIQSFEQSLKEAHNDAKALVEGKTPEYVTKMMADFGFHELEEEDYGNGMNYRDYMASVVDLGKTDDGETEPKEDKPAAEKRTTSKKKRQPKAKKADKAAEESKTE